MLAFSLPALGDYLAACRRWKQPDCLVVGHTAPDGDAVFSSLFEAFRRYCVDGTQAVPVVQAATLPREVAWLLGDMAALVPTEEWLLRFPDVPLVLTDHFEDPRWPHRVMAVIDHHRPGKNADFTGIDTTIQKVGATTTLVSLACRRDGLLPDRLVARMLLGAILLDTDNRLPNKTHAEDLDAIGWLAALCDEGTGDLYQALQAQLLAETDPAILYARDYRLYADRQGRPVLGFAILKVWENALPDKTAVRQLLAADAAQRGCRVCVAKIATFSTSGPQDECYLAAGEPAAVDTLLTTVLKAGGPAAKRSDDDEVYLPAEAVHRGRKWLASRLLEALEGKF